MKRLQKEHDGSQSIRLKSEEKSFARSSSNNRKKSEKDSRLYAPMNRKSKDHTDTIPEEEEEKELGESSGNHKVNSH